jgi:hypothetical protein
LEARGNNSARLFIGEEVVLDWGYRQSAKYHWDIKDETKAATKITILSGA